MQLHRRHDDLRDRDVHVLLISFGKEEWARAWRQETEVPFPLLLDQERRVYRQYSLAHSISNTWNLRTLWYYLREWLGGRSITRIKGDPHQMGGDFLIDAEGVVRFAHRSQEPTDRPEADTILAHAPAPDVHTKEE